ncbi:unnamed protein product [Ixodes hexagonus]
MNTLYRCLRKADVLLKHQHTCCLVRKLTVQSKRWMKNSSRLLQVEGDFGEPSADFEEHDSRSSRDMYKTVLEPDSTDHLQQQLLSSTTAAELLSRMSKFGSTSSLVHAAQAIVSLWDLRKLALSPSAFDAAALDSTEFQGLLDRVERDLGSLSDTSLTAVLVSLKRLLREPRVSAYHTLVSEAASRCSRFNLQNLSRFLVSLDQSSNVNLSYQCRAIVRLRELLPHCSSEEDLKCAAISLSRLVRIASPSLIEAFCEKTTEILTPASQFHTLLRCLPLVCRERHKMERESYTGKVLALVNPLVPALSEHDLASLADAVAWAKCNASTTLGLIQERARTLSANSMSLRLARCLAVGPLLPKAEAARLSGSLHDLLTPELDSRGLVRLMEVLLWLPVTDPRVLEKFWNRVARSSSRSFANFLRGYLLCFQQTRFKSAPFDREAAEWCLQRVDLDACNLPHVSLSALFLLSFDPRLMTRERVARLTSLVGQFSVRSLYEVALGLRTSEQCWPRVHKAPRTSPVLMELRVAVHNEMRRRVDGVQSLPQLSALTLGSRMLWFSKGHHEELKEGIVARCGALLGSGSPRAISWMCKALAAERLWLPDPLDDLVARAVAHPDDLLPVTLCHLVYISFVSGHIPAKLDRFARIVNDAVLRHFEELPACPLLQAAVALGFFQSLDGGIIRRIFTLAFMDRLDQELLGKHEWAQGRQLRELLGTLNRVACLDFPEERVPWFHGQYYRTRARNAVKRLLPLHKEVLDCLVSVLQGNQFVRCHAFTPYNYYLHFECVLDTSRHPVAFVNKEEPPWEQSVLSQDLVSCSLPTGHQRVAVIVLWEKNFCENFPQLTGYQLLKNRHLEILGYKLVPFFEWNSMKLSERRTKEEFLHAKIFGPS